MAEPGMPFVVIGQRDEYGLGQVQVFWQDESGDHGLMLGMSTAKRLSESLAQAVGALVAKGAGFGEAVTELLP